MILDIFDLDVIMKFIISYTSHKFSQIGRKLDMPIDLGCR